MSNSKSPQQSRHRSSKSSHQNSRDTSPQRSDLRQFQKIITFKAKKVPLWDRTPKSNSKSLSVNKLMPSIKLTEDIQQILWSFGLGLEPQSNISGYLIGHRVSKSHYLNVEITEAIWGKLKKEGDFQIKLIAQKSDQVNFYEIEQMYQSITSKINEGMTQNLVMPLDLFHLLIQFRIDTKLQQMILQCSLVYPNINLQFTPINPISIVSTPLSVKLTQKDKSKQKHCSQFQTGFLTLDQGLRVIPLLPSDKSIYMYPLVGIWVTGLQKADNLVTSSGSSFDGLTKKSQIPPKPNDQKISYILHPLV